MTASSARPRASTAMRSAGTLTPWRERTAPPRTTCGDGGVVAGADDAQFGGTIGQQDAVADLQSRRHGSITQRQGRVAGRHVGTGQRHGRTLLQLDRLGMQQAQAQLGARQVDEDADAAPGGRAAARTASAARRWSASRAVGEVDAGDVEAGGDELVDDADAGRSDGRDEAVRGVERTRGAVLMPDDAPSRRRRYRRSGPGPGSDGPRQLTRRPGHWLEWPKRTVRSRGRCEWIRHPSQAEPGREAAAGSGRSRAGRWQALVTLQHHGRQVVLGPDGHLHGHLLRRRRSSPPRSSRSSPRR